MVTRALLALLLEVSLLVGGETTEAIFQKAVAALSARNYGDAEQGFLSVLKREPRNVGAMGNLGVVYSRTERYAAAIEVYKRALRIAPGERFLSTNLGLAYIKQEQYAAALPIFEKLAADPANRQAQELLASCRLQLGQYEAARAAVSELLAGDPANPGLLYMLGVALTHLKRTDEAHAAFARMMEAANPAQANFLMGKAGYETGNFAEAADFLRKTIEADPAFEGAHRELGKTLVSLRDDAAAERELRLASPDDGEALYFLGALLAQSRPEEAAALLTKAQALNPDFWGPAYYLGKIRAGEGRIKEAVPLLERAAKLNPDESAIRYQLGLVLMKAGRVAEGRQALAKVQELKKRSLKRESDLLSRDRP